MENEQTNASFRDVGRAIEQEQRFLGRLARALAGRDDWADDLAQETALAALESPGARAASAEPGGLRAWLAATARNKAHSIRRASQRRQLHEGRAARSDETPDGRSALEARLDAQALLARALADLPAAEAEVLVLRFGEALDLAAIAERTSAPIATVKTRMQRGLARLRASMDRAHGGDRRAWASLFVGGAGARGATLGLRSAAMAFALVASIAAVGFLLRAAPAETETAMQIARLEDPSMGALDVSTDLEGGQESRRAAPEPPRETAVSAEPAAVVPSAESPWRVVESPTEVVPMATLRVRFDSSSGDPLHGVATLEARSTPGIRPFEFRGRGNRRSSSPEDVPEVAHFQVPAGEPTEVTANLDGFRRTSVVAPPVQAGETRELRVTLDPTIDSARVTLRPLDAGRASEGEPEAGQRFIAKLVSLDGEELAMPMRSVAVMDGAIELGRLPVGTYALYATTHLGWSRSDPIYHWAIAERIEVLSGAPQTLDVRAVRTGGLVVDALDPMGRSIEAEVAVFGPYSAVPFSRVSQGGKSSSGRRLFGDGPTRLEPQAFPPGMLRVEVRAPGFEPASQEVQVFQQALTDVVFRLQPQ